MLSISCFHWLMPSVSSCFVLKRHVLFFKKKHSALYPLGRPLFFSCCVFSLADASCIVFSLADAIGFLSFDSERLGTPWVTCRLFFLVVFLNRCRHGRCDAVVAQLANGKRRRSRHENSSLSAVLLASCVQFMVFKLCINFWLCSV